MDILSLDVASLTKAAAELLRELEFGSLLAELTPGGMHRELTARKAAAVLAGIRPRDVAGKIRRQLAVQHVSDIRALDRKLTAIRAQIAAMVQDSGTGLTRLFGVGPVIAGRVLAEVGDVRRFPSSDHFATYNGTAPLDVSSGEQVRHRLSRSGNRRINHAIHMMAVTQIRNRGSEGRAYYERKRLEGKTGKEALRCLKRQLSDAVYARLLADARTAAASGGSPGGQPGNGSDSSAAGSHPGHRLFGQATPEPATTLRPPAPRRRPAPPRPVAKKIRQTS